MFRPQAGPVGVFREDPPSPDWSSRDYEDGSLWWPGQVNRLVWWRYLAATGSPRPRVV